MHPQLDSLTQACQFVQAAVTGYHTGWLVNNPLPFVEAGGLSPQCQHGVALVRAIFQAIRIFSWQQSQEADSPALPSHEALIPFTRAPPSWANHLSKALLLKP